MDRNVTMSETYTLLFYRGMLKLMENNKVKAKKTIEVNTPELLKNDKISLDLFYDCKIDQILISMFKEAYELIDYKVDHRKRTVGIYVKVTGQ